MRRNKRTWRLLSAVAVAGLLLGLAAPMLEGATAYGAPRDPASGNPGPNSGTANPLASESQAPGAASREYKVVLYAGSSSLAVAPAHLTIVAGDTVTFANHHAASHRLSIRQVADPRNNVVPAADLPWSATVLPEETGPFLGGHRGVPYSSLSLEPPPDARGFPVNRLRIGGAFQPRRSKLPGGGPRVNGVEPGRPPSAGIGRPALERAGYPVNGKAFQ